MATNMHCNHTQHNIHTGILPVRIYNELQALLKTEFNTDDLLQRFKDNYASETATVTRTDGTGEEIRLDRRSGTRKTFGGVLTGIAGEMLITALEEQIKIHDIVPATHSDVIFYQQGDKFEFHRDSVPECPWKKEKQKGVFTHRKSGWSHKYKYAPAKFEYYTMLVGLLDTEEGGQTTIVDDETSTQHHYSESARQQQFILFPSEAMHAGKEIIKGYKMCFKIDFWILMHDQTKRCECDGTSSIQYIPRRNAWTGKIIEPSPPHTVTEWEAESYHYDPEDDGFCNGWEDDH